MMERGGAGKINLGYNRGENMCGGWGDFRVTEWGGGKSGDFGTPSTGLTKGNHPGPSAELPGEKNISSRKGRKIPRMRGPLKFLWKKTRRR